MRGHLESIRSRFPALGIADGGRARIYFDNPAGTQVPESVVQATSDCLLRSNANLGGHFRTSESADAVVEAAHLAMADFLNSPSPSQIVFGQNMTTLTLHVSRSIGRCFQAGDEIILSRMDHDANVWPWALLARDLDLTVRWLPFDTETFEFELSELERLLSSKTKLVCVGAASNLTGTINDVKEISRIAREAGAWTYIDGVQYAPHVLTDVQDLGCDFFACSAYKFFGPHQGILWGRSDVLERLEPYKVRPAPDAPPGCFETGTQSHEGMAGTTAAVDYFAWIGETAAMENQAAADGHSGRRSRIRAAMHSLFDYETTLARRLIDGLQEFPGLKVQGITAADAIHRRVPTVAFTVEGISPARIAAQLAEENIFVWSGHNYAVEVTKALGIDQSGGAVRVGPVHYNTVDEVDRLLDVLKHVLRN